MHAHDRPGSRSVRVHVLTVSTSRSDGTDRSGPLIRELLLAGGHAVAGHGIVPDDPAAIGVALDAALGDDGVEAVVLTGGTGVSARDCTPTVVRARLDRELPGFGELFRMLSWPEVGAAAMLSDAVGGVARGRPVFVVPGSTAACRLALEKLILPELPHLVGELRKEAPLPAPPRASARPGAPAKPAATTLAAADTPAAGVPDGLSVRPMDGAEAPPPEPVLPTGWRAALAVLGGSIVRGSMPELPDGLARLAAARDVLDSAGDRAEVRLADGRRYVAFGFPDLARNASRVLLVGPGEPVAEVVALHRWPARVGLCVEGDGCLLPSADADPGPIAVERTGAACTVPGQLLAVETKAIHLLHARKVTRFDGRPGEPLPLTTAVGSLLLQWSQR